MTLTPEAIAGIVSILVALPPTTLIFWKILKRRRHQVAKQTFAGMNTPLEPLSY
jgi:hypothetical protein